jgi:hypothetical protein
MRSFFVVAAVCVGSSAALAQVELEARMTVDNLFEAYISTSELAQGSLFLTGNNWTVPVSGTVALPGPGTYYLHVRAQDQGPPAMFIGEFTLNSPLATFENGTQSLLTNTSDWRVSSTGFGVNYVTPSDLGGNGTFPWGMASGISPNARYLWHPAGGTLVFFATTITVVPAPGALAALGLMGAMGLRRRR